MGRPTTRTIAAAATLPAAAGLIWLLASRPRELPGRATLVSAPESTVIGSNGAVRSVQTARLSLPSTDLDRLWTPANLENLGATYWRFLTRVTLGSVRVLYSNSDRRVTLLGIRRLTLLRFDPPEFEMEPTRAKISWQIKDGLLVARSGRAEGGLALEVRREPTGSGAAAAAAAGDQDRAEEIDDNTPSADGEPRSELVIEVVVTNFYPSIASWMGDVFYEGTQAVIHVMVTNAFLRSLASLELHQSKVGRLLVGSLDSDHPA